MRRGLQILLQYDIQRSRKVTRLQLDRSPVNLRLCMRSLCKTMLLHNYEHGFASYSGYKRHGWSCINRDITLYRFNQVILNMSSHHLIVKQNELTNCYLKLCADEDHTELTIIYRNKYGIYGKYNYSSQSMDIDVWFNNRKMTKYHLAIRKDNIKSKIIQKLVEMEQADEFVLESKPKYGDAILRSHPWFKIYYIRNKEEVREWFTQAVLIKADRARNPTNDVTELKANDLRVADYLYTNYLSSPFLGWPKLQARIVSEYAKYKKDVKDKKEPK